MNEAAPAPELTLRCYSHDLATEQYTNKWVANFEPLADDVAVASVSPAVGDHALTLYSVYPGAANQTFFARVPFWIFCDTQHVAQVKVPDVYPYFELPGAADDGARRVFVVMAPTLEAAKSKVMAVQ
jgi:hypothetical protein